MNTTHKFEKVTSTTFIFRVSIFQSAEKNKKKTSYSFLYDRRRRGETIMDNSYHFTVFAFPNHSEFKDYILRL